MTGFVLGPNGGLGPAFGSRPARVLVAGGGIAALEFVIALRKLAGEQVEIEVLAPSAEFVYRPLLVAEPFGAGIAHRFPLSELLGELGAVHHHDALASVAPGLHIATTGSGEWLPYNALVVATGARALPALRGALTFAGPADVEPLRQLVERATRGELRRLVFTLPEQSPLWPLPLYELALMTATSAPGVRIVLATPERAPLDLFGSAASDAVRDRLATAGIELLTEAAPVAVSSGTLRLSNAVAVPADAVIALPRLEVRPLRGLPHGEGGFLAVDELCRVEGLADVYAIGDVTSFRIKQGGVAVRQADAAASAIAARAGAAACPEPFRPLIRGLLLTGAEPSYLEPHAGASTTPLWWPPTKIADSYLVPYLMSRYRLSASSRDTGALGDIVARALAEERAPARRPGRAASIAGT